VSSNVSLSRRQLLQYSGTSAAIAGLAAGAVPGTVMGRQGVIVTPQGRELPEDAAPLDQQYFYENTAEPKHLDVVRDLYSAATVLNWGGEPMLRLDENLQIVPALADSYTAGPNAEYFDFVLRADAKWSDGTPITPDDWVFTFRHAGNPELDNPWAFFYYAIKGVQEYNTGTGTAEDIGVEKIDERTVRIYGNGPSPQIPALMTYQGSVPAPKHRAEGDPLHWADTVEGFVSSGPFQLVNWEHNQRLEWEPNPYYNGPHMPGVQRVVQTVGIGGGLFNAFLNKELDILPILDQAQLAQANATPDLAELIHSYSNFETKYVSFDTFNPPFDNLTLRQALSHAVDRGPLCDAVLQGTAVPAYSMLPPGFPAYNPDLQSIQTFDPDLAKQLLAEAGYPDGKDADGNQLELELFSEAADVKAQYLQDVWQQILGIKVTITPIEGTIWREMRGAHEMPLFINRYEYDYIDPSNLLTSIWKSVDEKGAPTNSWHNDQFNELVTQAGSEVDTAARMDLFQQAERILVEDVGGIFLCHAVNFQIWWPYLTGIHPDENGNVVFRFLDISRFQMYIRNDVEEFDRPH
jgi:oligopeptide transport system substrate-binding protein